MLTYSVFFFLVGSVSNWEVDPEGVYVVVLGELVAAHDLELSSEDDQCGVWLVLS